MSCGYTDWQQSCLDRGACHFREWQFCFHNCQIRDVNKLGELICVKRDMCFKDTCEKWEGVSQNDIYRFEFTGRLNPELDSAR